MRVGEKRIVVIIAQYAVLSYSFYYGIDIALFKIIVFLVTIVSGEIWIRRYDTLTYRIWEVICCGHR